LFKANPLKLLKKINISCIIKGTYKPDRIQAQRVVNILANVNRNNAAALDVIFLSKVRLPQGINKYKVLLRFFNGVDLLRASARVGGAAAVAREALSEVTESGDCKSTTSMLSKDV
jgi:hypothetical protein